MQQTLECTRHSARMICSEKVFYAGLNTGSIVPGNPDFQTWLPLSRWHLHKTVEVLSGYTSLRKYNVEPIANVELELIRVCPYESDCVEKSV